MKITFILSSLFLNGGNHYIVECANRLCKRGHQISLLYPNGLRHEELVSEIDKDVQLIGCGKRIDPTHTTFFSKTRITFGLLKSIPKSDILVFTHTPTTIIGLTNSFMLHKGINTWLYQDYPEMFAGKTFETWLLRNASRWNQAVFTISHDTQGAVENYPHKCPIICIGEGLSHPELFAPNERTERRDLDQSRPIIFYLGDERPRKGFTDFLKAIEILNSEYPNILLWIASKNEMSFSTPNEYTYYYRPSTNQLADLYKTCDIFVSSSWFEGFGLPPIEAMACGTPVVMTDTRGSRDYAIDGENCLLVPPQNPGELALAIRKLLQSPELRQHLTQNGPKVKGIYDWEKVIDRFESGLKQIIKVR